MAKILKPTLRERNRYLVFEVSSKGVFERSDVVDAVWSSLLRMYGEVGASKTSLWVMDWDGKSAKGILKVNHRSVETLRSSMSTVTKISSSQAAVNVLRVCGTLKKARTLL